MGTSTKEGLSSGIYLPYVDYTYGYNEYDSDPDGLYLQLQRGYNLRHNYPLNYVDPECEQNDINYPPHINIAPYPLHQGTYRSFSL